ncbi:hypothetical protein ID866_2103 [Astraeus odoratus]|nr:hypothetical protein ID866_2103 [Astraeus odoratus]
MHLLNARTHRLEHFYDPPPYAILSHLWRAGDAHRFHEIGTPGVRDRPGYRKVDMCCTLALLDGLEYVWMDTCCADANSSPAFSEALNSSYTWFANAAVCYVYLDDVDGEEDPEREGSTFRGCQWFKRAWTLQELLAPENMIFFSADWSMIGTKASLAATISSATSIHIDALLYPKRIPLFSIATRMSWVKERRTSKSEDRVYALMGLFGVHLPILYGGGETRAFAKLQQEIMKVSGDQSILAWQPVSSPLHTSSLLADSPDCFANCADVHPIRHDQWLQYCVKHYRSHSGVKPRLDFALTNTGLQITLPLRPEGTGVFDALLACARGPTIWNGREYTVNLDDANLLSIRLQQPVLDVHHYERVNSDCSGAVHVKDTQGFVIEDIHIGTARPPECPSWDPITPTFAIQCTSAQEAGFTPTLCPESYWTIDSHAADDDIWLRPQEARIHSGKHPTTAQMQFIHPSREEHFALVLGWDPAKGGRPWVYVGPCGARGTGEAESSKDWATWKLGTGQTVNVTVRSLPQGAQYKVVVSLRPWSGSQGISA